MLGSGCILLILLVSGQNFNKNVLTARIMRAPGPEFDISFNRRRRLNEMFNGGRPAPKAYGGGQEQIY